eukprot:2481617-Amphidinium_carterae.1
MAKPSDTNGKRYNYGGRRIDHMVDGVRRKVPTRLSRVLQFMLVPEIPRLSSIMSYGWQCNAFQDILVYADGGRISVLGSCIRDLGFCEYSSTLVTQDLA